MKIFKYILFLSILTLTFCIVRYWDKIIGIGYRIKSKNYRLYKNDGTCPGCQTNFTDNIADHKKAYYREGIKPQPNSEKLEQLNKKGILKPIVTNKYFYVGQLDYSYPYLLPKAHDFIYEICKKYNDSCSRNNLDYIPITITSLTRTKESVERLTRTNQNAISESAHLRGKTFDISYREFGDNSKQFELFTALLNEYRERDACFVKYESNGCLHITVN